MKLHQVEYYRKVMKSNIQGWNELQRKSRLKYAEKLRNKPRVKKRRKKSPRVKHKEAAIKLAKKIVRDEANGICIKCGKWTKVLHGSHIMRVSHEATAADPYNILPMCYFCHFMWWHKYPLEASEWFKQKWPGRYEELQKKANSNPDYSELDWKRIYEDLLVVGS